jgi:hypothetical protein
MLEGFLFKHNWKKKRELQRANPRVGWLALAALHCTIRVMKLMRAGTKKPALKRAGAVKSQHKKRKPFTNLDVDAGGDARTQKDAGEGGGGGMGMGGGAVYFFSAVVYARRDSGVKGRERSDEKAAAAAAADELLHGRREGRKANNWRSGGGID